LKKFILKYTVFENETTSKDVDKIYQMFEKGRKKDNNYVLHEYFNEWIFRNDDEMDSFNVKLYEKMNIPI